MRKELRQAARDLKRDLPIYQLALRDPRTPKLAKALLAIAVVYAMLPFDIVPDFIPIVGHLDDALVIPAMIRIALYLIPQEVMDECRVTVESQKTKTRRKPLKASSAKARSARLRRRARRR